MPRGPKRPGSPADGTSNSVHVSRIKKDPAAVALGRRGGNVRAAALSKSRRREIARQAAETRWRSTDRG
jgi:hypothetical protein